MSLCNWFKNTLPHMSPEIRATSPRCITLWPALCLPDRPSSTAGNVSDSIIRDNPVHKDNFYILVYQSEVHSDVLEPLRPFWTRWKWLLVVGQRKRRACLMLAFPFGGEWEAMLIPKDATGRKNEYIWRRRWPGRCFAWLFLRLFMWNHIVDDSSANLYLSHHLIMLFFLPICFIPKNCVL